jgi:hypothetical protein
MEAGDVLMNRRIGEIFVVVVVFCVSAGVILLLTGHVEVGAILVLISGFTVASIVVETRKRRTNHV